MCPDPGTPVPQIYPCSVHPCSLPDPLEALPCVPGRDDAARASLTLISGGAGFGIRSWLPRKLARLPTTGSVANARLSLKRHKQEHLSVRTHASWKPGVSFDRPVASAIQAGTEITLNTLVNMDTFPRKASRIFGCVLAQSSRPGRLTLKSHRQQEHFSVMTRVSGKPQRCGTGCLGSGTSGMQVHTDTTRTTRTLFNVDTLLVKQVVPETPCSLFSICTRLTDATVSHCGVTFCSSGRKAISLFLVSTFH